MRKDPASPAETTDPAPLCAVKLPFAPLLGEYVRRTEPAGADGALAWHRLFHRLHARPAAPSLPRTKGALLGGLAAAVLGVWLLGRPVTAPGGSGGCEGTSGTAPGTGGSDGTDPGSRVGRRDWTGRQT
jgi:hypothetical protein